MPKMRRARATTTLSPLPSWDPGEQWQAVSGRNHGTGFNEDSVLPSVVTIANFTAKLFVLGP